MYIVVGSITTATRLAKILEKTAGIPASAVHTPSSISRGGCSYSVRTNEQFLNTVRMVISEFNIRIKAIYIEEFNNGEREYRAIS